MISTFTQLFPFPTLDWINFVKIKIFLTLEKLIMKRKATSFFLVECEISIFLTLQEDPPKFELFEMDTKQVLTFHCHLAAIIA